MSNKPSCVYSLLLAFVILFPAGSPAQGLKGEYYHGTNFNYHVLTRIDSKIDFSRRLRSPAPDVRPQFFSIRWSGSIHAPRTGLYTFHVLADDGIRIWVNKVLIIDAWVDQEATYYSGSIMLEGGQYYDIRVEYYNTIIHSVARLSWQLPPESYEHFGHQLQVNPGITTVPSKYLSPVEVQDRKENISLVVKPGVWVPFTEKPEENKITHRKQQPPKTKVTRPGAYTSNEPIVLRSVHFEQGRDELSAEAFRELDNLSEYLARDTTLEILIIGHTDYVGDSIDNQVLSENRALAVATYLEKSGIDPRRISSRGLGGNQPVIVKANTDRVQNRRVEFVLSARNTKR